MKEEYLVYLTIQIYKEFDLDSKHLLIDVFYEKINEIYNDYLNYDNKNMSLLDSINQYISDYKNKIWETIKKCYE